MLLDDVTSERVCQDVKRGGGGRTKVDDIEIERKNTDILNILKTKL
jgi:hypothetical protein